MSISSELRTILTGDTAVAALVSSRVYPAVLPQNASYPAIRYSQISGGDDYDFDGMDNFRRDSYQLTCVGLSMSSVVSVADAVRSCLSGYVGTQGTKEIMLIRVISEFDAEDVQPANIETTRYLKHIDIELIYKE